MRVVAGAAPAEGGSRARKGGDRQRRTQGRAAVRAGAGGAEAEEKRRRAEAGKAQSRSRRDEAVQAGCAAAAGTGSASGRGCGFIHSGRAFGTSSCARARREYSGHSRLRSGRTHLDGRCHRVCAAAAVWRRCGAFAGVAWRRAARLQQMGSGRAQGDERRSPDDRAPADTGVEHRAARVPARSRGHYGRRDAAQAAVEEIRSRGKGADHHHGVPDEDARRGPEEVPADELLGRSRVRRDHLQAVRPYRRRRRHRSRPARPGDSGRGSEGHLSNRRRNRPGRGEGAELASCRWTTCRADR